MAASRPSGPGTTSISTASSATAAWTPSTWSRLRRDGRSRGLSTRSSVPDVHPVRWDRCRRSERLPRRIYASSSSNEFDVAVLFEELEVAKKIELLRTHLELGA